MKKLDVTPICDRCGKVAPINEEQSNKNWIVYTVKEPCECGGKFRARCLVEMEKCERPLKGAENG